MPSSTTRSLLAVATSTLLCSTFVAAQTYANCNPLTSGSCPPDSALGKAVNIDFTQGASDSFTPQGNPTYDSNGASFTIAKSGDSPQITSKWYIMFGHVEFVIKAAPGAGIVSSAILQSDDLDEIDWEWLGADDTQAQSNYFGKGQTTTYNRGAFHADAENQNGFHTYTIDWTSDQIVWQIDGTTVRVLQANAADGQYPQTPMQIKVGAWSGGDPSNAPGTIQWAGGPTNYAGGPYSMQMKSVAVTDYSTGTQYTYAGTSGTWNEISAVGGSVNPSGSGSSPTVAVAPAVTSTSSNAPMPFDGTHSDTTSTAVRSGYPWTPSTLSTSTVAAPTTYPGLPSGWSVTSSGKVVPPTSASSTPPPQQSASSSSASSPASSVAGGLEIVTTYDQQGFITTIIVATETAGASPTVQSYDQQGFLITSAPVAPTSSTPSVQALKAETAPSSSAKVLTAAATGRAPRMLSGKKVLGAACGIIGGALIL
ncbi:MAG: hypothetical protein M1827_006321 [Pycnora praestabilis]|nr:MAG: hypothetical protein M1827_006321 [Pycnora praestabilis]